MGDPPTGEELAISKTQVPDASMASEQGQLLRVRNRLWLVSDTVPHEAGGDGVVTRVDLESLECD